jgi:hypothetical protein
VRLRVVPLSGPTYVCVDTGPNTGKVFEGIIPAAQTFRGRRLRVNIGHTPVKLSVNGAAKVLPPGPGSVAFDITPRRTRPIPPGVARPCA